MEIDKSWTKARNRLRSLEFRNGLREFINRARPFVNDRGLIKCPCKYCANRNKLSLEDVHDHILRDGFAMSYDRWIYHGEPEVCHTNIQAPNTEIVMTDETIDDMMHVMNDVVGEACEDNGSDIQYDELFDALHSELHPGVSSFSSLNFLVKLMHMKVVNKWTNKSFDDLLKLQKLAYPEMNLVDSHYEAKRMLSKLGLGYTSIHVCKNDCVLFWKEYADRQTCPICKESRWMETTGRSSGSNVPHKVLRYFPLTPRLRRLFAMEKTAKLMRWHSSGRSLDEDVMRHPVDGKAWNDFDRKHSYFASEIRNVRLALAADGFSPFHNMSQSYSMWPVVMTTYNLPPWLCMKPEYLMLTLLIPGPRAPGKDMDVFLQPLVDELKELWTVGINVRDAGTPTREVFKLHAALLWTVNDFPARSSLSGWSGQGYMACPTCNKETSSVRVRGKISYVGHRRFLPLRHRFRNSLDFTVQRETRPPPHRFTSEEILEQLSHIRPSKPGKADGADKRKRYPEELNWRKKSIFYELPYWSTIELKHNIDVMHVEKNVCDSLLGTILGDPQKSKDTVNARRDLMDLGIRRELHLYQDRDKWMMPAAGYTLSTQNRQRFCNFIRSIKFPDGFAANLRKNVPSDCSRIIGLKSHDCHIILQRLLPVACTAYLDTTISTTIIELCAFFKQLCARSLRVSDMLAAREKITVVLCKMERIFPPAFFDIMIHLVMHLPEEAILGGPVYMRWMYPFERYLKKLKDYVRNPARPEGSIAEGYVVEEALTFCSRYFDDVETRFNRPERNQDVSVPIRQLSVFKSQCRTIGKRLIKNLLAEVRKQAMFYILNNCPEIETYAILHKEELQRNGYTDIELLHRRHFHGWFYKKIMAMRNENPTEVTEELMSLSSGCSQNVYSYAACIVNGVRFLTYDRDMRRRTQNSGISAPGIGGETYYGQLKDIIEVQFLDSLSVVLFQCKWFKCDGRRIITNNNITSIDVSMEDYMDDQFILATQAKQVFYIADPARGPNWRVVQEVHHRGTWDFPITDLTEIELLHDNCSPNFSLFVDLGTLEQTNLQRDDGEAEEIPEPVLHSTSNIGGDASFINDDELEDDTLQEYESEDVDANGDAAEDEETNCLYNIESD